MPGRGGKITDTSPLLTSSPLPITHLLQAVPTLRGLTGVSYVALKSFHYSFQPSEQTAVKYKYNLTSWWHLEPRQKATMHQNQLEEQSTQGCRVREVDLKLLQFKGKNITNQICFYTVLITTSPRGENTTFRRKTRERLTNRKRLDLGALGEWTVEQFTFSFQTRADHFISIQFIK